MCGHGVSSPVVHPPSKHIHPEGAAGACDEQAGNYLASERVDAEGGRERNEAPSVHGGLRGSARLTDDTAHHAGHGNALLLVLGQQDAPQQSPAATQEGTLL